jgi:hypothetical protein
VFGPNIGQKSTFVDIEIRAPKKYPQNMEDQKKTSKRRCLMSNALWVILPEKITL